MPHSPVASTGSATVQSVDRALLLLELLAQAGGRLAISDLAGRSGLPIATVHRLLTSLAVRGYVRQDPDRRYALGTSLLPLGDAATQSLAGWARPFLAELAAQSGETSNLAVLENDHVVYVAQAPGRHRMRMFTEVGRRALPHSTAMGKVLLAWQDEDHVRRVLARLGLPPRTGRTITTAAEFTLEMVRVRERGWADDDEEEEIGVRCVAVPVVDGARVVAALSVSAPASRLEPGQPDVVAVLQRIAADLAGSLTDHRT